MQSKLTLAFLATCAVAMLSSCSGLNSSGPCVTDCGGGNASVTISLFDTPPTGTSVLSFTLPIAGISLTPSSGSPVNVATAVTSAEVVRLQSDSTVIVDAASVAANTYTTLNVTLGPTSSTNNIFVNTSGSTITSGSTPCLNGAVCALPAGAIFTVSIPLPLTLTGNQNQWIGLDFNLSKAITSPAANTISVDLSQTGVLTATTTVRTGIPSGSVDTMEDFIGVVTAYTAGSSITVRSGTTNASLTAALNSSTDYDLAPTAYSQCTGGLAAPCLAVGTTVSMDTLVAANGTFTASEVDVLDSTAVDEVEGIIYPTTTAGVIGMVLADKVSATGNATLSASSTTIGSLIFLTLNASNYSVDTKTLSTSLTFPAGFSGTGNLLGGQVVRAQISNMASGSGGITASAQNMLLRYSRLSGTVNIVSGNVFTTTNLPSYIYALNPALSTSTAQINTFPNLTAFDGITALSDSTFQTGTTFSIRALYLDSPPGTFPFQAAKVRVP